MNYLHTYEKQGRLTPVIHRDLKSPNLLLVSPPSSARGAPPVVVKVADFGLSRDKEQTEATDTVMMTGCGSVLWMAPEILLGKTYNEKVDVFSFGMCVLEMVDCNLPWAGTATPAEVPHRVTKPGLRPTRQLRQAKPFVRRLIEQCWQHNPARRPSFAEIVAMLQAEQVGGLE